MKIRLLLLLLIGWASLQAQVIGDQSKLVRATDSLIVDVGFMKANDTIVYLTDVAYFEWSSDGVNFSKGYTEGDLYARYSGFGKTMWDTLNFTTIHSSIDKDSIWSDIIGDTGSTSPSQAIDSLYFIGQGSANVTISNDTVYIYADEWGSETLNNVATASNVGTSGVGLFDAKVDSVLNFRNLTSSTSLLTVTLSEADSTVDLDLALKTITAGVGLTGGGNMENDLNLNYNIPTGFNTSPSGTVDADNDWVSFYDADSAFHYKVHPSDMFSSVNQLWSRVQGNTGFTTPDNSADSLYVLGASGVQTSVSGDTLTVSGGLDYGLQSGGAVTWLSGLDFSVSAADYFINGDFYSSPTATVTLQAADATHPRIDIIVVDTSGTASVVKGVPAASPAKPSVNPVTQIELTEVLLLAGATEPSIPGGGDITNILVYDENVEWTGSATRTTVDFASTAEAFSGSISADVGEIGDYDLIGFTDDSTHLISSYTNVSLYIKLKETMPNNHLLRVDLVDDGIVTGMGKRMTIDKSSTDWQLVSFGFDEFVAIKGTTFDEVRFWYVSPNESNTIDGFYIDKVRLQGGLDQGSNVSYQELTTDGTAGDISITNGNSITLNVNDADADSTNEIQSISLDANILSISDDASTVDLSVYLDNTDSQDLTLTGNTLAISGDPNTDVDLSTYAIDRDSTNETITALSYDLDTLTITEAGTDNKIAIKTCNNATQTLTSGTDTLDVANGVDGVLDIGSNTTIRIEPTAHCKTGNITVLCDVTGYTIEFVSDYTMKVSPTLSSTAGVITTTATTGAVDVYSYWWDGTRIIINGTKNYD